MNLEQLLQDAPELYAALIEEGTRQERERALAHLDTARYYDALAEAVEAVRCGTPADDSAALHDAYAEIEDTREALDDAVTRKQPPATVANKAESYDQATKRLAT